jgi:hypothetical protein
MSLTRLADDPEPAFWTVAGEPPWDIVGAFTQARRR